MKILEMIDFLPYDLLQTLVSVYKTLIYNWSGNMVPDTNISDEGNKKEGEVLIELKMDIISLHENEDNSNNYRLPIVTPSIL